MNTFTYEEILQIVTEIKGITPETLSIATGIKSDVITDSSIAADSKNTEKAAYLLNVMALIANAPTGREDEYLCGLIASLKEHLMISEETVARYAGVGLQELNNLLIHPEAAPAELKYKVAVNLMHLLNALVRKP